MASKKLRSYFNRLVRDMNIAREIAEQVRSKGMDPSDEVEIKIAPDMPSRVEGLVGPKGIAHEIRKLVNEGMNREEVAVRIGKKIISDMLPENTIPTALSSDKLANIIKQAIRTSVAIITDGVLVAQTEGIPELKVMDNPDGSRYVAIYYAGPIRSAGGTSAAVSVLLADIMRKELGLQEFRPTEKIISRYIEEINLYDARCSRLQYLPSEKEIRYIVSHCPVCITGEPTSKIEVSTNRDVESVETNYVRGGMALVIGEGIAQKSAKILKISKRLGNPWTWLEGITKVKTADKGNMFELKPINTFMADVVAGRPVFSYPMRKGGFRLRYGRTRATGVMAKAFHPAVLYLLDEFPAIGTQLKLERPGKACIVTQCKTIEPPVVKLKNGNVIRVDSVKLAKDIKNDVEEILFLGDILSPIGDFIKTAHPIIPSGYVEEWWIQDCIKNGASDDEVVKRCMKNPFTIIPSAEESVLLSRRYHVPLHPRYTYPWNDIDEDEYNELKEWLDKYSSVDEFGQLVVNLSIKTTKQAKGYELGKAGKRVLELLYVPHTVRRRDDYEQVVINHDDALALSICLGLNNEIVKAVMNDDNENGMSDEKRWESDGDGMAGRSGMTEERSDEGHDDNGNKIGNNNSDNDDNNNDNNTCCDDIEDNKMLDVLGIVNKNSMGFGVNIKNKISVYIGSRMGRPEKAKQRAMKPPVNVLFPVGMARKNRNLTNLYRIAQKDKDYRFIDAQVIRRVCKNCNNVTMYPKCEICGHDTVIERTCLKGHKVIFNDNDEKGINKRGKDKDKCPVCGAPTRAYDSRKIDIVHYLDIAKKNVGENLLPIIKAPKGLMSKDKVPELLEKGILRAKYGLNVFKDGTCRFDFVLATLTHFKPKEIGTSVEKLRELGYTHDYKGKPLVSDDQVVEIFPQDTIVSEDGLEFLFNVSQFIDDMLVYVYKMPPFYKAKNKRDLIGHLIGTQSPHTGAGVLSRVIGSSKARVGWYHPYLICATRRNCDGDEDSFYLLLDVFINFSRRYLPSTRGGTQDTPLVLSTIVNPLEIDDEVYVMDINEHLPLEFFEESERYGDPLKYIKLVKDILGTDNQYEGFMFTHDVDDINNAPTVTTYVKVENMIDKMYRQFELDRKIRAVDVDDAVRRMIVSHFLPDMYGNLRTFSRQTFRCVVCNAKYRRVPLRGVCTKCGGKLVLTVSEGNIEKYLKVSTELAEKYHLPDYLKQRLYFIKKDVESIFVDEKKKQVSLMEFM